ncbi:MAG: low molecular weight protein-tyrosine-phosphatase [Pseudomonadota bacterium]
MIDKTQRASVLFVCMGNICRSPTAEGYFRHHLAASPLAGRVLTDSAGTHSYHIGNPPDSRAMATIADRGIDISDLRARRVLEEDFDRFDLILAMDEDNLHNLRAMNPGGRARVALMLDWGRAHPHVSEVPDPYYGGQEGFEFMCDLLDDATHDLLSSLEQAED